MKRFALISVSVLLTLIGCFSDWKGDEGTLIINLGGGSNGRSVVEWPPYGLKDDGEPPVPGGGSSTYVFIYKMKYVLTLDGPTGIIEKSAEYNKGASAEDVKFMLSVAPGRWNVKIKAYVVGEDNFLYASGSNVVSVREGKNNAVGITMYKEYDDLGNTGPGGGIIFYVEPEGFRLFMDENDRYGIIAHYLEAATEDCVINSEYSFAWESDINQQGSKSIYTNTYIGTGKRNTTCMLNGIDDDYLFPAASACKGYNDTSNRKKDWFIPSKDEIMELYLYNISIDYAFILSSNDKKYWTSSQYDSDNAYFFEFDDPYPFPDNYEKSYPFSVRLIRAY